MTNKNNEKKSVLDLIRPEFRKMKRYVAPRSGKNIISMSANENPYCFMENENYNRYPELESKELKDRLANIYNVSPENIIYGRGSSEMIELLVKLFCIPFKDSAIICSPTYMMYPRVLEVESINCLNVELKEDLQLNVDEIIKNGKRADVKIVFIPNPNAPLGHTINKNDILKIVEELQNDCFVVVDEAYIEWTEEESLTKYLKEYSNLGILRTLSKYYGLANLRVGSFIADEEIVDNMAKLLAPYSTSSVVSKIAIDALDSKYFDFYEKNKEMVLFWKDKIIEELKKLNFVEKVFESKTNFITFISKYSDELFRYLDENNIIIIPQEAQIHNSLRISVGLPEENKKLIELLRNFEGKNIN